MNIALKLLSQEIRSFQQLYDSRMEQVSISPGEIELCDQFITVPQRHSGIHWRVIVRTCVSMIGGPQTTDRRCACARQQEDHVTEISSVTVRQAACPCWRRTAIFMALPEYGVMIKMSMTPYLQRASNCDETHEFIRHAKDNSASRVNCQG